LDHGYNPRMHTLLPMLLAVLLTSAGAETVLQGVFCRQDILDTQISCAQFRAHLRYIESDLKSGKVKLLECDRLATVPSSGEQTHEFGSVCLNGEQLEGKDREKEIESLRSKGMFAQRTFMPFLPETRDEYEYRVAKQDTWRGMRVWKIEFTPMRETDRHIRGSALVLDGTFDIVSMEFAPSDLPFVVTGAGMRLSYDLVNGLWLPVSFEMDMDLRLAIIFELMRRHIRIEETYCDYNLAVPAPARTEDDE